MDRSEAREEESATALVESSPHDPLFVDGEGGTHGDRRKEKGDDESCLEKEYGDRWRNFSLPVYPWWFTLWQSSLAKTWYPIFVYGLHFVTVFCPAVQVLFSDAMGPKILAGATFLLMVYAAAYQFIDNWRKITHCGFRIIAFLTLPIWVWGAVLLRQWHYEDLNGPYASLFLVPTFASRAETVDSWVGRTLVAKPTGIKVEEERKKARNGEDGDEGNDKEETSAAVAVGTSATPAEANGVNANVPTIDDHPILHRYFLSLIPHVYLASKGKRFQLLGLHGVVFSFWIALFWIFLREDSGSALPLISISLFVVNFLVHQSPVSTWDCATLAHRLGRHTAAAVDVFAFLYLVSALYWGPVVVDTHSEANQNNLHLFGGRLQIIFPIGVWFVFVMAKVFILLCAMLSVVGEDQACRQFTGMFMILFFPQLLEGPKLSWVWSVFSLKNAKISDSLLLNFIIGNSTTHQLEKNSAKSERLDRTSSSLPSSNPLLSGWAEKKRRLLLVIALTSCVVDPLATGVSPEEAQCFLDEKRQKLEQQAEEHKKKRRLEKERAPLTRAKVADSEEQDGKSTDSQSKGEGDTTEEEELRGATRKESVFVPEVQLGVPQLHLQVLREHQRSHHHHDNDQTSSQYLPTKYEKDAEVITSSTTFGGEGSFFRVGKTEGRAEEARTGFSLRDCDDVKPLNRAGDEEDEFQKDERLAALNVRLKIFRESIDPEKLWSSEVLASVNAVTRSGISMNMNNERALFQALWETFTPPLPDVSQAARSLLMAGSRDEVETIVSQFSLLKAAIAVWSTQIRSQTLRRKIQYFLAVCFFLASVGSSIFPFIDIIWRLTTASRPDPIPEEGLSKPGQWYLLILVIVSYVAFFISMFFFLQQLLLQSVLIAACGPCAGTQTFLSHQCFLRVIDAAYYPRYLYRRKGVEGRREEAPNTTANDSSAVAVPAGTEEKAGGGSTEDIIEEFFSVLPLNLFSSDLIDHVETFMPMRTFSLLEPPYIPEQMIDQHKGSDGEEGETEAVFQGEDEDKAESAKGTFDEGDDEGEPQQQSSIHLAPGFGAPVPISSTTAVATQSRAQRETQTDSKLDEDEGRDKGYLEEDTTTTALVHNPLRPPS